MTKMIVLLLFCIPLLDGCATAAKSNEDARLDVQAAVASLVAVQSLAPSTWSESDMSPSDLS